MRRRILYTILLCVGILLLVSGVIAIVVRGGSMREASFGSAAIAGGIVSVLGFLQNLLILRQREPTRKKWRTITAVLISILMVVVVITGIRFVLMQGHTALFRIFISAFYLALPLLNIANSMSIWRRPSSHAAE